MTREEAFDDEQRARLLECAKYVDAAELVAHQRAIVAFNPSIYRDRIRRAFALLDARREGALFLSDAQIDSYVTFLEQLISSAIAEHFGVLERAPDRRPRLEVLQGGKRR